MTKTRNRLISVGTGLLLFIAAVLFIIPQKTAGAETWIESAAEFAAGDGTQGAPYQISSAGELANLAKMVSGGETYGNTAQLTPHCHKKSDMLWNSCKLPIRLARAH